MLLRDRSNWPKVEPTKMLQQCSCLKQSNKSYLACLEDSNVVACHSIVVSRSKIGGCSPGERTKLMEEVTSEVVMMLMLMMIKVMEWGKLF